MYKNSKEDLKKVRKDLKTHVFIILLIISIIGSLLLIFDTRVSIDQIMQIAENGDSYNLLNNSYKSNLSFLQIIFKNIILIIISVLTTGLSIEIINYTLGSREEDIFSISSIFEYITFKNILNVIGMYFVYIIYLIPAIILIPLTIIAISFMNIFSIILLTILFITLFLYIFYIQLLANTSLILIISGEVNNKGIFEVMKQSRKSIQKNSVIANLKVDIKYALINFALIFTIILSFMLTATKLIPVPFFLILFFLIIFLLILASVYLVIDTNYVLAFNGYSDFINKTIEQNTGENNKTKINHDHKIKNEEKNEEKDEEKQQIKDENKDEEKEDTSETMQNKDEEGEAMEEDELK